MVDDANNQERSAEDVVVTQSKVAERTGDGFRDGGEMAGVSRRRQHEEE